MTKQLPDLTVPDPEEPEQIGCGEASADPDPYPDPDPPTVRRSYRGVASGGYDDDLADRAEDAWRGDRF